MDYAPVHRLRAPEAEVWIRLRPPTLLEATGRGLVEDIEFSDELLDLCCWMMERHAEATWGSLSAADLREAAGQLIAMVTPVTDEAEEVARRINTWAAEWSFR